MKNLFWALVLAGITLTNWGQVAIPGGPKPPPPELPRFDLEFPGGTPRELVAALNKPLKDSLNVILSPDSEEIEIPPLKLKQVNVQQVFEALRGSSERNIPTYTGDGLRYQTENYTFSTTAPISENSVWSFRAFRPASSIPAEPPSSRFYQLSAYLDSMKIDDIITAIQTGWEMLGQKGANLKFHPETKLLIAVGKKSDFAQIDDVLKELAKAPRRGTASVTGEVKKPGAFALPDDRKLTVAEALAIVGGFTDNADTNRFQIARAGRRDRSSPISTAKETYLEPNDEVVVSAKPVPK